MSSISEFPNARNGVRGTHKKKAGLLYYLKLYFVIGGMTAVVNLWLEQCDFVKTGEADFVFSDGLKAGNSRRW
ncbi:MAG: hypothetical protein JW969_17060 [Spirochaetales bacterium]|nr:hypothetical protein [Spirochaetales bacterium]